jgi:hypothetical protein
MVIDKLLHDFVETANIALNLHSEETVCWAFGMT